MDPDQTARIVTYTYTKTANAGINLRKIKHALTDKIKSHEDVTLF
jgi:hypothetical protein